MGTGLSLYWKSISLVWVYNWNVTFIFEIKLTIVCILQVCIGNSCTYICCMLIDEGMRYEIRSLPNRGSPLYRLTYVLATYNRTRS